MQAFLIQHETNAVEFMGNRTECALLMLLRSWGARYEDIRSAHKAAIFQVYNFSSERKMASVLLRHGDGLRLYNKVRDSDPGCAILLRNWTPGLLLNSPKAPMGVTARTLVGVWPLQDSTRSPSYFTAPSLMCFGAYERVCHMKARTPSLRRREHNQVLSEHQDFIR